MNALMPKNRAKVPAIANIETAMTFGQTSSPICPKITVMMAAPIANKTMPPTRSLIGPGMFVNHAFTPNWILRMHAGFLNLNVGDFEGRYLITNVSIDWIFTKHFGLGAGLSRSDVDFKNKGGDHPYTVQYRLGGPSLYASLVF